MSVKGYDSFLVTTNLGANRKVRRLTPAERWCAVHGVWAIAAESPERGALWIAEGVPATEKDYAELAGVSVAVAKSTVTKMRELRMLEPGDGAELVHDWDQHQVAPRTSPSETPEARRERKRLQREREAESRMSRNGHEDVTSDIRAGHEDEVEEEVEEEQKNSKGADAPVAPARLDDARDRLASGAVRRVFEAWIESTGRTSRTELDPKRRNIISQALKKYPEDEVIAAVRGWRHEPHNRGENSRGRPFNDIGLLLRDAEHIERFRDLELASQRNDGDSFLATLNARNGLQ